MPTTFFYKLGLLWLSVIFMPGLAIAASDPDTDISLGHAIEDQQAWLTALSVWGSDSQDPDFRAEIEELLAVLAPELKELAAQAEQWETRQAESSSSVSRKDVLDELALVEDEIRQFCTANKATLTALTKPFFDRQSYRVGVSYDRDPKDRLVKWALFGQGLFRLNSFWQKGGRDITRVKETINETVGQLRDAEEWGLQSILIVNLKPLPESPEDFVFTQDLVPTLRPSFWAYNFNSARLRDELQAGYRIWGEATADVGNIAVYQMNNEPFWSTAANPILGYDPMTIGCSLETWKAKLKQRYSDIEAWKAAFPSRKARKRNDALMKGRSLESFYPWESLDEADFDLEARRGLTFVEFLQRRYSDLEALNQAWFGGDTSRWFDVWEAVFPPLPVGSSDIDTGLQAAGTNAFDVPQEWVGDLKQLPLPARDDVPAWTDWAEFWAWTVNDFVLENRSALLAGGAKAPVSTNAVTGHCINNYLYNAADGGLFPWTTSTGLDALGIDFYVADFLQPYMALLRGAANSRPVFIHETTYQNPLSGQYVAMYCYAFGATGCSFWLRGGDHDVPVRGSVKLLELCRALDDQDLQHASSPYSEGIALWYSLDTLYLNDALSGSPEVYLRDIQAGFAAMTRAQRMYDVYADLQLREGVPDSVKVLFAPGVLAVDEATLARVRTWVEQGGALLISKDFATFDRYGVRRDSDALAWLEENSQVQFFDAEALRKLREGMNEKSSDWPFNWAWDSLPPIVKEINAKLSSVVEPQLFYRDASGKLSPRAPAMRVSPSAKYIFVDPWATDVTVELSGEYGPVMNLFTSEQLPSEYASARTRVVVEQGPAVLKFSEKTK